MIATTHEVRTPGLLMASNQFVIISFAEERTVLAGGNPLGKTNSLLTVNSGTHTFTLDDPQDYDPPLQRRKVANTSVANPLRISFQKRVDNGTPPDP